MPTPDPMTALRDRALRSSTAWLLPLLLLAGCAGASYAPDRDAAYGMAVEKVLVERWSDAARASWQYLEGATPDDERYDRAQMLMARAMEGLDLTHAASLWYLDVAQARRLPDVVDEAVAGLERIVLGGPHDEATIVRGFLATAEVTAMPPRQRDFVAYMQGLDSVRRDLDDWADAQFARIGEDSPYHARARFVRAVRLLSDRRWEDARAALEELHEDRDTLPSDVRTEAALALARLSMEQRRWREAVERYEEVEDLATTRPELLLEMAWAYFYLGDSRQALGRLIALDAPAYQGLIAPERFLLEAFCLRRLCQFEPARIAAVRLREAYGDAIDDIYGGVLPLQSEPLRAAAKQRGRARELARFLARLEVEERKVRDSRGSLGDPLTDKLLDVYADGLFETERRLEEALRDEVRVLADELVAAEDGVRLVLHELSVGLLRGRRRPPGPPEAPEVKIEASGERVFYRFVNEFWTDEVDDLLVRIEDRCLQ